MYNNFEKLLNYFENNLYDKNNFTTNYSLLWNNKNNNDNNEVYNNVKTNNIKTNNIKTYNEHDEEIKKIDNLLEIKTKLKEKLEKKTCKFYDNFKINDKFGNKVDGLYLFNRGTEKNLYIARLDDTNKMIQELKLYKRLKNQEKESLYGQFNTIYGGLSLIFYNFPEIILNNTDIKTKINEIKTEINKIKTEINNIENIDNKIDKKEKKELYNTINNILIYNNTKLIIDETNIEINDQLYLKIFKLFHYILNINIIEEIKDNRYNKLAKKIFDKGKAFIIAEHYFFDCNNEECKDYIGLQNFTSFQNYNILIKNFNGIDYKINNSINYIITKEFPYVFSDDNWENTFGKEHLKKIKKGYVIDVYNEKKKNDSSKDCIIVDNNKKCYEINKYLLNNFTMIRNVVII